VGAVLVTTIFGGTTEIMKEIFGRGAAVMDSMFNNRANVTDDASQPDDKAGQAIMIG